MSRELTPRHAQTSSLSSSKHGSAILGRIVPTVTIAEGNYSSYVRDIMSNTIASYHGHHQYLHCSDTALAVPVLIRELHWHSC